MHFFLLRHAPDAYGQALELLETLTPRVMALPPDGADLDVTGALRFWDRDARGPGDMLRLRIAAHLGIQTTFAAAPNRMLAATLGKTSKPIVPMGRRTVDVIVRLRFSRAPGTISYGTVSFHTEVPMPDTTAADGPIRRPRMTPDREMELLQTALDVLCEVGYEALSMDSVATRARCSKATLYRQWKSKSHMVIAALFATSPVDPATIDTGTLRGDLLALGRKSAAQAEKSAALFAALGHAILVNGELATAVRTTLLEAEIANMSRFVDRAVERGELPTRPASAEFLPQLMFSAVMSRQLFDATFADSDYVERFIEHAILPALLPPENTPPAAP
ncbi:TetR/AcrR family transcriptional regulator C-terminal ligand-binding domain-containing protein [Streptomyces sp. enrichment culture]|uniref:TetR/AcrR family transcriptional regulator n=1 Tax=Streptomyces sp. enrichment culture TaxID=1795815 RepID=UPI003F576116